MGPHKTWRAFTLVELLVATGMGVLVTALAFTAFARAKTAVARTTARVDLHQSASMLQDAFETDFANMAPALGLFARSTPTLAGGVVTAENVEIIFMRSTAPLDKQSQAHDDDRFLADHHWVRWRFTRTISQTGGSPVTTSSTLRRSTSSPRRIWYTNATLKPPAPVQEPYKADLDIPAAKSPKTYKPDYGEWNGTGKWMNIPRALRDTSSGVTSLDNNRYGIPSSAIHPNTPNGDIGDLADLDVNERIVSSRVRDLQIGWVNTAGDAVVVDGSHASDFRIDGLYMDVVGPDDGLFLDKVNRPMWPSNATLATTTKYNYRSALKLRPRLLRYALRMEDAKTGVTQTFSGSIAVPGMMPPINQPTP